MKQKILDALKKKFPGVSDTVLGGIADELAKTATTEAQVKAAVEAYTAQQLLEAYSQGKVKEAQAKAVTDYEKKHGLKDGVKVNTDGGKDKPKPDDIDLSKIEGEGSKQITALLKQLADQNKQLTERLEKMETSRTADTRRKQLTEIISRLPESNRKGYERISLDNMDDDAFDKLKTEVTAEVEGIVKEMKAKGVVFGAPRPANGAGTTGTSDTDKATKEEVEKVLKGMVV